MTEAAALDFPFVQDLPKREKSKLRQWWDEFSEYLELNKAEGGLVPISTAAKALKVSRTRIDQLVEKGELRRVDFDGHLFISVRSIKERAEAERSLGGRPKNS